MRRLLSAVLVRIGAVFGSRSGGGRREPDAGFAPDRPSRRIDPFGDSDPTPYAEWYADGSPVVPAPAPDDAAPVRLAAPIRVRITDLPEHVRPTDVTEN